MQISQLVPNLRGQKNLKMSRFHYSSLFIHHQMGIFLLSSLDRAGQEDTAVKGHHFQKSHHLDHWTRKGHAWERSNAHPYGL